MCGIAGFWDVAHRFSGDDAATALHDMMRAIRHRGPDDEGYFQDPDSGIALGHRRLSIIDPSPQGHQPMASSNGRYMIVFNGEIYNHARLRPDLEKAGCAFRGHSDTEVMLAAIEHWGLEAALVRFIGMFAFALWDKAKRTLTLVRDHLGIKPLYCGWAGGRFAFASELKALTALPGFDNPVDRDALCLFMRHNVVPAPYSIYRGIGKLMPGTLLRVDAKLAATPMDAAGLAQRAQSYWSARAMAESGTAQRVALSDDEAMSQLDALLRDAIALRMEADVPLGAFLSGGVDSSTVVALMQTQSPRPVQTFSIGFDEREYNEAQHAKAVAQHLGTDHHELYLTPKDALDIVPLLPAMWDEPFGDSSQIPTYLVSKLARDSVTVSLSGDGGDELFAGYNRHFLVRSLWRRFQSTPVLARQCGAAAIRSASPAFWDSVFAMLNLLVPARLRVVQPGHKLHRLADVLGDRDPDETYRRLVSQWTEPGRLVIGGHEPESLLARPPALDDFTERMLWFDLVTYLPDDILTKVDRASMAVSLEARVPLLDHRVVEFAWRIPIRQKVRGEQGKWLLRQVLYKYVPRDLIERPKKGFGIPIEHWLRGPLRDWAEDLLDEQCLREEGYFDPVPVRRKWREHLAGHRNWRFHLWSVLMFQAWLKATKTASVSHDLCPPVEIRA
jgi:asparagine synthase (glutamine-hydrolysing)